jgi:hypothetical protein
MTPKLPSLRALTRELRELHEAWSHPDAGGEYVALTLIHDDVVRKPRRWRVRVFDSAGATYTGDPQFGREFIPGSALTSCACAKHVWQVRLQCNACNGSGRVSTPSPFDAVAAARRLLAAAREGMSK